MLVINRKVMMKRKRIITERGREKTMNKRGCGKGKEEEEEEEGLKGDYTS